MSTIQLTEQQRKRLIECIKDIKIINEEALQQFDDEQDIEETEQDNLLLDTLLEILK